MASYPGPPVPCDPGNAALATTARSASPGHLTPCGDVEPVIDRVCDQGMSQETSTFVVLEGLQDPRWAAALSRRWAEAGWPNRLDVAGQSAVLKAEACSDASAGRMDQVAAMAAPFGVIVHDRVGRCFVADNTLAPLQHHVAMQMRQRFAVALTFGLPVVVLQYAAPFLVGTAGTAGMAFPWLFQMLLTGWACIAAGWPLFWNAGHCVLGLRPAADFLAAVLMVISFATSLWPLWVLAWGGDTPLDAIPPPMFHATVLVLWIALAQRWLVLRSAGRLRGRASWMLRGHSHLVAVWCVLLGLVGFGAGWPTAVGFGMLLPPRLSFGAINRPAPGWSAALPVFAFAVVYLFGPRSFAVPMDGIEIEVATGFAVLMTLVFAWGWRGMTPAWTASGKG